MYIVLVRAVVRFFCALRMTALLSTKTAPHDRVHHTRGTQLPLPSLFLPSVIPTHIIGNNREHPVNYYHQQDSTLLL